MAETRTNPPVAGTHRLAWIFAALGVAFVAVLASAPLRPYLAEWRAIQEEYNRLARSSGQAEITVAIQQIWKPRLGISDRCITCHLGMGSAGPVGGNPLFKAHPPIPHEPREYGCTVCHGGQGRATRAADAHGFVSHWDEEMLGKGHLTAGCGTCHDRVPSVRRAHLDQGMRLVERMDCLSCHRMDGRGRGNASDLSYAGLKGYRKDWHAWHLSEQARDTSGLWATSYGAIEEESLRRLETVLSSRVGMSRVVEAQAHAMELGCLGCHKLGGRGGEEGPALDAVGRRAVGDLNFNGVPGEETLVNYLRRHFLDPAGVVPGSLMPEQAASLDEADLLTSWVLFLRARELPSEFLPKNRIRRSFLGEVPAPLAGADAFLTYCAGCHGPAGEGRNYGNNPNRFPAIGSPDFLGVVSDAFIAATVKAGRPGRRMPALASSGGALSPGELSALVSHIRSLEPAPASLAAVSSVTADPVSGPQTYREHCATCHGVAGEGTPLGPPMSTADGRVRGRREASYGAVVEGVPGTAMPRYRAYDAARLRALLEHVSNQPQVAGSRASWKLGAGNPLRGSGLYARTCAGCHGARGEGKTGPALGNSAFQQSVSTEYLAATIVRGRAGTPMPAFGRDSASYPLLTAQEVLDIAAHIRTGFAEGKGNR